MTRAKFVCRKFEANEETAEAILDPVVDGSKENEDFFKYTPGGEIRLSVVNPNVKFEEGKEYYVDFTEA